MDAFTKYLATKQVYGTLFTEDELCEKFNLSKQDLTATLDILHSEGELDYQWLDKVGTEKYLYLTKAEGVNAFELLLPTFTEEAMVKGWACQIYSIALVRFRDVLFMPEAVDRFNFFLPKYKEAFLIQRAKELIEITGKNEAFKAGEYMMLGISYGLKNLEYPEFLPCIDVEDTND